MFKVVLFDIDGTLLNFLKSEEAGIKSCFKKLNLGECNDEMIKEYSLINQKYWQKLERKEITKEEVLVGRFKEFFARYHLDTSVCQTFNDLYQIELGNFVFLNEGCEELLKFLKGKTLLVAVTNGTKIAQNAKLKKSGIDQFMDYIFISEDVGFNKPDIRYFDKIFTAIGKYKKDEILIVGDSLTSDILGGINYSIRTCWYNPEGNKTDKVKPDYIISNLSELKNIVLN